MDKTIYSITLGDDKVIEDLTMNGNNFVSQAEVTEDDFTDLSQVTITGSDGTEEILKNVELNQIAHYSDGWYFILRELTPEEIRNNNNEAQIFYTAIATDTLMED